MQWNQAPRQEAIIGGNPRELLFVCDDDALQIMMMAIMLGLWPSDDDVDDDDIYIMMKCLFVCNEK